MENKMMTDKFRKALKYKRTIVEDISLDELEKLLNISKATLSRIENGETPKLENFIKILNWLEHDANDYIKA